ncbi:hypothetical protein BJD20_12700 [Acinetobacter proteolyticus]|uniref:hypothetical protein n=1 Tax=Acinetobacter proteolyticus TaxID=1776741 RepID=UPI00086339FF|nr:hypothetical protein [Acinetobacter proteolyticus]OEY95963.1 hypothetical protein BJD20_12700 [Acinetobacter proteolyticus]
MKLSNIIENIFAITFVSLLFIFALTWIIFNFNDSTSALKDTWTTIGSFFGGVATLVAAYIAYSLYDDWRKPHNLSIETEHKKEILKVIRKIIPLEDRYYRLLCNYLLYENQPERTMPIELNQNDLTDLINNINELLGLLDELHFITNDKNIENLKSHYLNYAQLYHYILNKSEHLYKNADKEELFKFLKTKLEFDFVDLNNEKWTTYTLYGYAMQGMHKVHLRKYISENLKLKEN